MAGIGQGLNPSEVVELIAYIQQNNSWENMTNVLNAKKPLIKYYQMFFDTRSGEMWKIKFQIWNGEVEFRDSPTFKTDIYNYLNKEVVNYESEK